MTILVWAGQEWNKLIISYETRSLEMLEVLKKMIHHFQ